MTRFVRTYHNDRDDPGSRLIIDYDPDGTGEFSIADQTVLPEKVHDPDCRRVTLVGSIELDRNAARWARDAFIELCRHLDAEEQELPPAKPEMVTITVGGNPIGAAVVHNVIVTDTGTAPPISELARAATRCPYGNMPREAGAGHWRDWHRGHGCHLDPDLRVIPSDADRKK